MSIAAVQLKHTFGLKGDVTNNVAYLDEQTILLPVGSICILYNIDQKNQKFITCASSTDGMTAMAVSPNKRYAAVAEKGEKPTVTIVDLHTLRKRKVLSFPDLQSLEFVSLAFSPDSKYLIAQGGAPGWVLVYWGWEKAKVMTTLKTTNQHNSPIKQVSFNPKDNTSICIIGETIYKQFRYTEGNLKQHSFQKAEPQNYLCHAWLSETRLIIGTDTGKVQLFEGGDMKNEFEVPSVPAPESSKSPSRSSKHELGTGYEVAINCITTYSKGFLCSGGSGTLHLFEKTDEKNVFKHVRSVSICVDPNIQINISDKVTNLHDIMSLSLSPSEENVVCSTRSHQLYSLTLSAADLGKAASNSAFSYLSQAFHSAPILGMDVCLRKPLVATCSQDRSVRIWNYEQQVLDIWKEFQEEAYSVALHPSGLFVLVGFSEKLRLLNILIDELRVFKEISIRGCRECRFSNGGHLFAAANSNLIQVYGTFSFENVGNLKGHSGKVRSIGWNQDDTRLVSCSSDGAVYEWNVHAYKREGDCVVKNCSYTSLAVSGDARTTYAVGTDCTLKELNLMDSTVKREISVGPAACTQISLSRSGRMMFCGTANGVIRAVKFPLGETGDWQDYQSHTGPINRLCVSWDDQFMFSAGTDGSLFIYKVADKDGRGMKRDKEITYSEEILITKSDLEEKNTLMSELKTRVDELKMENEYQLRLKDMNYSEKIKEMSDKFLQEKEDLTAKLVSLQSEKEQMETKHNDKIQELKEKQQQEIHDLSNADAQKLMNEYEKYQELQARNQKLQEDYERQLVEMEASREKALNELTEMYEGMLHDKALQLDNAREEQRQHHKEWDEMRRQIEEDSDMEILDIRNKFERKLREEKEENIKLRGEYGITKKKVDSLQNEIGSLKGEIQKLESELRKREAIISSLKVDIDGLRREIQERDDTIQDKEKRIYDLKKKNQELEKFKFVLDYKIKELRRQMEPKENEIKAMKEQIKKMESELEESDRENKAYELALEKQDLKLQASNSEMMKERIKVHDMRVELQNIKAGLHGTSRYIQEPKQLKEKIKELYRLHLGDFEEGSQADQNAESDMHSEYARQRKHLEHSVAALRKKLSKDTEIHRMDNIRVMQENVTLLKEVNDLRKELKTVRSQLHNSQAAMKILQKNVSEVTLRTTSSQPPQMSTVSGIVQVEPSPNDQSRIIDMQRTEISKLRLRIRELESGRPHSGTRLPPLGTVTLPVS